MVLRPIAGPPLRPGYNNDRRDIRSQGNELPPLREVVSQYLADDHPRRPHSQGRPSPGGSSYGPASSSSSSYPPWELSSSLGPSSSSTSPRPIDGAPVPAARRPSDASHASPSGPPSLPPIYPPGSAESSSSSYDPAYASSPVGSSMSVGPGPGLLQPPRPIYTHHQTATDAAYDIYRQSIQDEFAHLSPTYRYATNGTNHVVETRPRKRRGNLPKPVTDLLKSWFRAHQIHPYPSEEEKQILMGQTGLTITQLSNWFINARRRELPEMERQARASAMTQNNGGMDSDDS